MRALWSMRPRGATIAREVSDKGAMEASLGFFGRIGTSEVALCPILRRATQREWGGSFIDLRASIRAKSIPIFP